MQLQDSRSTLMDPQDKLKHKMDDFQDYLANIFRGRIEYELIYSLRGAKHRVDYSVHIRQD